MAKWTLIALLALAVSYYFLVPTPQPPSDPPPPPLPSSKDASDSSPVGISVGPEMRGDLFSSKIEDNHVEYRKVGDFSDEFRVFGVTPNELENSPVNHVSAFVTLARLLDVRAMVAKDGCERRAAQSAKTVAVVVADEAVASKLEEVVDQGGEIRMSGRILEKSSHTFAGAEPPSTPGLDVEKIYLIEGLLPALSSTQISTSPPPATSARKSGVSSAYSWNFSPEEGVAPPPKVAPRPKCKQRRVVRIIRRCPR